jgi:hypothetical protein
MNPAFDGLHIQRLFGKALVLPPIALYKLQKGLKMHKLVASQSGLGRWKKIPS